MNRAEILEAAQKCVCGEREQTYGAPEKSFSNIAGLWTAYKGVEFSAKDVAVMMALLKVGRIMGGNKDDNYIDACGYLACAGEIAAEAGEITSATNQFPEVTKMVTMRDLVAMKYPERVKESYEGGVGSCPRKYGFEDQGKNCVNDCEKCWSRLVPADTEIHDYRP